MLYRGEPWSLCSKNFRARRLTKTEPEKRPVIETGMRDGGLETKQKEEGRRTIWRSNFLDQQRRYTLYGIRRDIEGSASSISHDEAVP